MERLGHELLVEICRHLPSEERYNAVSLVNKAWYSAARDPASWETVDMEDSAMSDSKLNQMVVNVVNWSRGAMVNLYTRQCDNDTVLHVGTRCPKLRSLSIVGSQEVSDKAAATLARNCPKLEYVDVSGCPRISVGFLKALASNCRSLTTLKMNGDLFKSRVDEEARLIGTLLPCLKHLEMGVTLLSDKGLELIAGGCPELEYLELGCCFRLSNSVVEAAAKKLSKLKYLGRPQIYGQWSLQQQRYDYYTWWR